MPIKPMMDDSMGDGMQGGMQGPEGQETPKSGINDLAGALQTIGIFVTAQKEKNPQIVEAFTNFLSVLKGAGGADSEAPAAPEELPEQAPGNDRGQMAMNAKKGAVPIM